MFVCEPSDLSLWPLRLLNTINQYQFSQTVKVRTHPRTRGPTGVHLFRSVSAWRRFRPHLSSLLSLNFAIYLWYQNVFFQAEDWGMRWNLQ